ncbi:hypothetical protein HGG76_06420 [Ochrobactrum tritici]|jgi:hypothetical protein|uniref:Uncharacterized protein n=1 Tax=Brucella tritici TaxID=94626 RepID=A0A7X6FSH2_9HYPH|nr:hypothetical protein [Brucella tritici]
MSTNGVSSFHTEFSGCSGPACFWEDERRLEFQENVMAENRIIFRKVSGGEAHASFPLNPEEHEVPSMLREIYQKLHE